MFIQRMGLKRVFLPSVSRSTARFWKMSMCDECAMVDMLGVWFLLWM